MQTNSRKFFREKEAVFRVLSLDERNNTYECQIVECVYPPFFCRYIKENGRVDFFRKYVEGKINSSE